MSKISFKPADTGTATFTLEAPATNTNRTITLPDEAGTLATVENLTSGYTDSDALDLFNATGSAPVYACRAWVNFDGTGTVSIRDSGNVSSITDNGTGNYTVNFATAMPDNNYATTVSGGRIVSNGATVIDFSNSIYSTTEVIVQSLDSGLNAYDFNLMCVSVFR